MGSTQSPLVTLKHFLTHESTGAIQPAWVNVSSTSSETSADWFAYETLQLTDEIIANLSAPGSVNASLFDFGVIGNTTSNRSGSLSSGQCKTAPGDASWPSTSVWETFNSFLGGSLINTVPLASPCYHDWGNYDADLCAIITANWSDWSYMQYVTVPDRRLCPEHAYRVLANTTDFDKSIS